MTSQQETYIDEYEITGEFHDLFVPHSVWDRLIPAIDDLLGSLPKMATLLDIGAGTGLSTRTLVRHTHAQVTAIELSVTMRTGLVTRLSAAPDLRVRVSVLAEPVPHALRSVDTPATRIEMFQQLNQCLTPEASGPSPPLKLFRPWPPASTKNTSGSAIRTTSPATTMNLARLLIGRNMRCVSTENWCAASIPSPDGGPRTNSSYGLKPHMQTCC